ncbi:hypothetical protein AGMMS50249_0600 [candidate division SR1 bacterium]|nr:hypothetical protein AGMMS50249_0600 [candidate division SR1 bacterium]
MDLSFFDQKNIQKTSSDNVFNTETMLPVSEIRDGIVILKDGGLRGILKVDGVNLDLKNSDELEVILEQYKRFLNGLDFPIQILARNTYLDLTDYLEYIRNNVSGIDNPALKEQSQSYLSFLEGIDNQQGLVYVKEFYVIVPYYAEKDDNKQVNKTWREKILNVLNSKDNVEQVVSRYRSFLKNQKQLETRLNLVQDGLISLRMQAEMLGTNDVVSLLFRMYNPLLDASQAKFAE